MKIFNDEVKEEFFDFMLDVTGNADCAMFCVELLYIFHTWDDLHDKDKDVDKEDVNRAFIMVFDKMRRNPFFKQYESEVMPLVMSAILQWIDANKLEAEGELDGLRKAYMLRAAIYQVWAYCVFLLKGYDFYQESGAIMQKIYDEDFDEYLKEFTNA